MANTRAKEAEERWLIGGVVFCTLCIDWIREPSVINAILVVAVTAGVVGLYEAAKALGKLVRRPKV